MHVCMYVRMYVRTSECMNACAYLSLSLLAGFHVRVFPRIKAQRDILYVHHAIASGVQLHVCTAHGISSSFGHAAPNPAHELLEADTAIAIHIVELEDCRQLLLYTRQQENTTRMWHRWYNIERHQASTENPPDCAPVHCTT